MVFRSCCCNEVRTQFHSTLCTVIHHVYSSSVLKSTVKCYVAEPDFNFVIEKGIIIKLKKSEDESGTFSHKVCESHGKADVLGEGWLSKSCSITMEWSMYALVWFDHEQLVCQCDLNRTRHQTAEKGKRCHLSS